MYQNDALDINDLLVLFGGYANTRVSFLSQLKREKSCRDPLAEFSEILVARILNATQAANRVQKGYDLIRPNGRHVQVKYLANPCKGWINWHTIKFTEYNEEYALTIFVTHQLQSVLLFPHETIGEVCRLLKKRHPNQDISLQFTERNHENILTRQPEFQVLGVEIFRFDGPVAVV